MADILIRGIPKPTDCGKCFVGDRTICSGDCPLVELPQHGDLIDVSKVVLEYGGLAKISPYDFVGIAKYFAEQLKKQPVIVPAERREE